LLNYLKSFVFPLGAGLRPATIIVLPVENSN
jgi:hypothetical protein